MSYQIKGKVKRVGESTQASDTFKYRDLIIETEDQYPQVVKLQFTQDRCDLLNPITPGQVVEVDFGISGKEMPDGKVFNNLNAWRIKSLSGSDEPAF